jgi:hypothetical protein
MEHLQHLFKIWSNSLTIQGLQIRCKMHSTTTVMNNHRPQKMKECIIILYKHTREEISDRIVIRGAVVREYQAQIISRIITTCINGRQATRIFFLSPDLIKLHQMPSLLIHLLSLRYSLMQKTFKLTLQKISFKRGKCRQMWEHRLANQRSHPFQQQPLIFQIQWINYKP